MEAIIERLKASRAAYVESINRDGTEAGRIWASESAEFGELKRLSEWWHGETESSRTAVLANDEHDALGLGAFKLASQILDDATRSQCEDFWDEVLGDEDVRHEDEDFIRGFAKGAVQVFDEVKDQL